MPPTFELLPLQWWLVPLGFVLGAFGTLIGAGGGFVLVPLLLLLYPTEKPDVITAISLAVVFLNSVSGSIAYASMKRIDYKSGIMFSLATIPGAVLGALSTSYIPRKQFDELFGVLMILGSIFLVIRPISPATRLTSKFQMTRRVVDAEGMEHSFCYNPVLGVAMSLVVGYLSSFLGVGGGFIHVPALVYLLNFPVHVATATSHFILAVMTFTGSLVHMFTGTFARIIGLTVMLGIGVLPGAQLGAKLSTRVNAKWILRGLAAALGFVGLRLIFAAIQM
ncbi:MAG TPA: sulfite exporter TauE/SafE family protein [Verrucomicrobiae bacterium]|nr:sulfite exporter TauE/SafE family protein [Verrucomicrobiae bacterium]